MNIELVQIFVKVVRLGGFTKAAEHLRIPKSTVSKAVTKLEEDVGTKLLLRTTRSQTLTPAGRAFYDSCLGPIHAIEDAQKSLSGNDSLLSGTLKITAPEDLGNEVLAPAIGQLIKRHPALNFELVCTDRVIDLVRDGFDLAVRIGHLKESALKFKKIGDLSLILVASPQYLKNSAKIQKPADLLKHACLTLGPRPDSPQWTLKSKRERAKIQISPRVMSNQMSSLLKVTLNHAGIAKMPSFFCQQALEEGAVVRVLPEWSSDGPPVSLVSPLAFSSSARLRMTSDFFFEEVQKVIGIN